MQLFIRALLLILSCFTLAQAAHHCLDLATSRVVIHKRTATVHANTEELHLPVGHHVLTLCNLTSYSSVNMSMEEDSLQVTIQGSSSAVVHRIMWQDVLLGDGDSQERPDNTTMVLEDLRQQLKNATNFLAVHQDHDTVLASLSKNLINSQHKELVERSDSLLATLQSINQQRIDLYPVIAAQKVEIARLTKQIDDLQTVARRTEARRERHHVAQVTVFVAREESFEVKVQYLVNKVSWQPQYEVHVNTTTNQLRLEYNAVVTQRSLSSWDNVSVELSTGEPVTDRSVPVLSPWFVECVEEIQRRPSERQQQHRHHHAKRARVVEMAAPTAVAASMRTVESTMDGAQDESGEEEEEVVIVDTDSRVTSTGVSEIYSIAGTHTLPRDQSVTIKVGSIVIDVNISRTAVPLKSTKVFMRAVGRNTSPYTILEGASLVYLDGTFEAKASVPSVGCGGIMSLDVGVDHAMTVARKEIVQKSYKRRAGWVNHVKFNEYEYLLVVKSKRPTSLPVTVIDQVPRSVSKDLTVTLEKPVNHDLAHEDAASSAEKKKITLAVNTTLQEGELRWHDALVEEGLLELPLRYTIEYPADRHLTNR